MTLYANGNKYEGRYVNGMMNGQGVFTWADGSTYIGHFKNDK